MMVDRSQAEVALQSSETGLDPGQEDVDFPDVVVFKIFPVGANDVPTRGDHFTVVLFFISGPFETLPVGIEIDLVVLSRP
jgi:hypothetical protein